MFNKKQIKIIITVASVVIAGIHIIFPKLNIDVITVLLIGIAIIPWLEPLFKSVELPGGLKLEFQELQKIETEAKKVGLINQGEKKELRKIREKYSFVEIAEQNQELSLVSLRIEIEKRLREIAAKYSIDTKRYSILKLIDALSNKNILTVEETNVLKNMITTLNQAAHGVEYDKRTAGWVIENGPPIVDSLENRILNRGVIFHSEGIPPEHWIDKSFRECKWATNVEWIECITKHQDLWNKELKNIFHSLLNRLEFEQKSKLSQSQEYWEKQNDLDKDLIYSFQDFRLKVGREGQILSYIYFMKKIRDRALELEEILTHLV